MLTSSDVLILEEESFFNYIFNQTFQSLIQVFCLSINLTIKEVLEAGASLSLQLTLDYTAASAL